MKSMTGYASRDGTFESEASSYRWTWDIKSVNGKSLDVRLRTPPFLNDLDQNVRKAVQQKFSRGNLQVSLNIDTTQLKSALVVNEAALVDVIAFSTKMEKEHNIAPITMDGLIAVRGLLDVGGHDNASEDLDPLKSALMLSFDETLDDLAIARSAEGEKLAVVLDEIVIEIQRLTSAADEAPERKAGAILAKLKEQLATLQDADSGLSEERLHQEALLMASKADIREELDRLVAHITAARELFADKAPVGRRLDFLAQEFNREANTLCSKANDIALTKIGLALKAAIEQLREQVQNVE